MMDRMFRIEIRCEGAAFGQDGDISDEVSDILESVVRSLRHDHPLSRRTFRHKVFDSNGNSCGTVTFEREE